MKAYLKEQVKGALLRYIATFSSPVIALKSLSAIADSTVKYIKSGQWELVTDTQWQNLARQVGFYTGNEWQQADTSAYLLLRIIFSDAHSNVMAYGVAMPEGLGKTFAALRYTRENDEVSYIKCSKSTTKRQYAEALAKFAGVSQEMSAEDMIYAAACKFALQNSVERLIILDDVHLLSENVLGFVFQMLEQFLGKCGLVLLGDDVFRMRLVEGVRKGTKGYEEAYKNIGRRFITLGRLSDKDVDMVCRANGVKNDKTIESIVGKCGGNLHLVTEEIKNKHIA